MDDPCVNEKTDKGDSEMMITAFTFLKGLSYDVKSKDPKTGELLFDTRHIVSNNGIILNYLIGRKFITVLF